MNSFSFEYSPYYLIVCALVAAAISALFYYKNKTTKHLPTWVIQTGFALRFLALLLLLVLLVNPLFKAIELTFYEPHIVVVRDNSESIALVNQQNELQNSSDLLLNALNSSYTVDTLNFDALTVQDSTLNYSGKVTNFNQLNDYLETAYSGQNVGAVVLLSDGIVTDGIANPSSFLNLNVPFYTVAVGDTNLYVDWSIQNMQHNDVAYLNNKYPIDVSVKAIDLKGESSFLKLYVNDSLIETRTIKSSSKVDAMNELFLVPAEKVGMQKITAVLENNSGESNLSNNAQTVYVEVLKNQKSVLIYASSPHPDIKVFYEAIAQTGNYEISVQYAKNGLPAGAYNLIIAHQLPDINHPEAFNWLLKQNKESVLYVVGEQSQLSQLNELQNVVTIQSKGLSLNTTTATINQNFKVFTLPDGPKNWTNTLPSVFAPFGTYNTSTATQVVLNQTIGGIKTDQPLWAVQQLNGIKKGIIVASGLYKWRIQLTAQLGDAAPLNELILKTVQYLSNKQDQSKFRIDFPAKINALQNFKINAELYNDNFELINNELVTFTLIDSAGLEYQNNFLPTQNAYQLQLTNLKPGSYRFVAKAIVGTETYSKSGSFVVEQPNLEGLTTTANIQFLRSIASETGGEFHWSSTVQELADNLIAQKYKPTSTPLETTQNGIHWWLFLALVAALLTAEWFLRRYFGSY